MKIGFQTVVWGPRVRNLGYMLDVIARAGYQGVELFQQPEVLGSIEHVLRLLNERNLQLIGLAGGSLGGWIDFCGERFRPEYVYVDTWNEEEAMRAMEAGFTLGLHPHAYMPVNDLAAAMEIIREHPDEGYPRLKVILDTAHLMIARDDPVRAVQQTKDRLVAVHLKDWSPEFGRSSFRYARGFTELGGGSVDLDAIISALRQIRYDGWLIAEQDYTLTDPDTDTLRSARWFATRGILPAPAETRSKVRIGLQGSRGRETPPLKREVLFLRQTARARLQDISSWYDSIAVAFRKLIPCKLVEVWSGAPKQDVMSLLASRPEAPIPIKTVIPNRHDFLSGTTMERKAITHFDLTKKIIARRFEHSRLVDTLGLTRMISLPIFNPWNLSHVRLILNLFPSDGNALINDDELFRASANVAFAFDKALDDMCSRAASKVNFEASRCASVSGFLRSLATLVRRTIDCKGVGIFLVNDIGDKLELKATTGTKWMVPEGEHFYRRGEGLTGSVWETGETLVTPVARSEVKCIGKSFEGIEGTENDDCLFVPLSRPNGDVAGVIRCRRKNAPQSLGRIEGVSLFSEADAAVLEAMAQAAVTHLEVLTAQEQREKALTDMKTSLRVLGHEATQLNFGLEELRRKYLSNPRRLSQLTERKAEDICRDIEGYVRQLDFLFRQAAVAVTELPELDRSEFWAYREILFKWQDTYRLEARIKHLEFDICKTWAGDPWRPPVYGDQTLLEQLVYNLVSNAVKYCYPDTKIGIDCRKADLSRASPHVLTVTDYGREFTCANPFQLYTRGENVKGIEGLGIGLHNAKRIADAHGALFEYVCERVCDFNVPLIESYIERDFEGKTALLARDLRLELTRLKESKQYEKIVKVSKFAPSPTLYRVEEYELASLIVKPTWKVTFTVAIPAKGTRE